jgi:urate oxidase
MARAPESETAAGGIFLGQTSYGKSDVRLVKVRRGTDRHELTDVRVDVALEGDFEAAHTRGENTGLLATDTMRNTVYALAKDHLTGEIEEFGKKLVEHLLEAGPTVERVRVRLTEHLWDRIMADGREHEHSFVRAAGERTATVEGDSRGVRVGAGIDDLLVLKTTNSGWEGFLRERYTTLPETDDRILSTVVNADWTYYDGTDVDFGGVWRGVREQMLVTFTDHYSPSVQNTLYRMGEAVLERFSEIERIHLSLPNRHHLLYDLQRFGMENEDEVFHADPEPYGLIEGSVERRT